MNVATLFDDMTSKIKTVKICRYTTGCFESTPVKYLSGNTSSYWNDKNGYKFVMNTGEFVRIYTTDTISLSYFSNAPKFTITIDINGLKKPNQYGYDVFGFAIRNGMLIPVGIENNSAECTGRGYGYDCAYKVLTEGKLPKK